MAPAARGAKATAPTTWSTDEKVWAATSPGRLTASTATSAAPIVEPSRTAWVVTTTRPVGPCPLWPATEKATSMATATSRPPTTARPEGSGRRATSRRRGGSAGDEPASTESLDGGRPRMPPAPCPRTGTAWPDPRWHRTDPLRRNSR